ncbi:MAG TPA: hypothetical protein VFX16_15500 [Pseudonocardiaceae bacterium]|nr:hypothetical protein [Pseudonocardiaceae bacterium]
MVLRYWEDLSIEAVADAVGVSIGVVKTRSTRSPAKRGELLGQDLFT